MKISYLWLKSLIKFDHSPQKVAKLLTESGLEVTRITPFHFLAAELILGRIIESKPHPNADKLRITKVDIGQEKPLSIVCGAPNAIKDHKVVVAPVGTKLVLANHEAHVIKKVKIRGEISEGMLCAEDEIGLGSTHNEIVTVQTKYQPGTPMTQVWNTPVDTVFEIEATPNRNEAMSHFGVARDLAAKFEHRLNMPAINPMIPCDSVPIKVSIKEKKGCPRYTGVVIKDIHICPSPMWMQHRLRAIGISPINNVIDITNFLMHDLGQPLHAFDYDQIDKGKIKVKKLPAGTLFTSLDSTKYTLTGEELMICDSNEDPLCMAGIIGGDKARITENTKRIFLESAYFDPIWVYKTAKHHKIHTEASLRYMRGANPCAPYQVLQKAAAMIQKYAQGTIASMFIDEAEHKMLPTYIPIEYDYIYRIVGTSIPAEIIHDILRRLDIGIKKKKSGFIAIVKPYRNDVKRPVDIVEEILRIYGYEKLKNEEQTKLTLLPSKTAKTTYPLKCYLASQGYHEIITNSLISSTTFPVNKEEVIIVDNPLSQQLNSLRTTLLFSGLEVIKNNLNRGQQSIKIFEIGHTYHRREAFKEIYRIGIWLTGYNNPNNWTSQQEKVDMRHIKNTIKDLCMQANIPFKTHHEQHPHYETCLSLIQEGDTYGHLGEVANSITAQIGIDDKVFFAELNVIPLLSTKKIPTYKPLSKYPEVTRDISMALPQNILFEEVEEVIKNQNIALLKKVDLIDYYQGKSLRDNQKSYTLRFSLQSNKKTLSEKDIHKVMKDLTSAFEEKLGAIIR